MSIYDSAMPLTMQLDLEALDVTVLTELSGEDGGPAFAVGWPSELAAGLRGGELTPWFNSRDELVAHWFMTRAEILRANRIDPDTREELPREAIP